MTESKHKTCYVCGHLMVTRKNVPLKGVVRKVQGVPQPMHETCAIKWSQDKQYHPVTAAETPHTPHILAEDDYE